MIKTYKDLIVWRKSIDLSLVVYKALQSFPADEKFGLCSQIKRAVISIPSNIAEGRQRSTRKDFCQFLRVAVGSCAELETQLLISYKLGFLKRGDFESLEASCVEISRMINGMIRKLTAPSSSL